MTIVSSTNTQEKKWQHQQFEGGNSLSLPSSINSLLHHLTQRWVCGDKEQGGVGGAALPSDSRAEELHVYSQDPAPKPSNFTWSNMVRFIFKMGRLILGHFHICSRVSVNCVSFLKLPPSVTKLQRKSVQDKIRISWEPQLTKPPPKRTCCMYVILIVRV